MDFTKNSDVFIENGVSIAEALGIRESLKNIQKWNAASGALDTSVEKQIEDALHAADYLCRCLIDLQVNLLTFE